MSHTRVFWSLGCEILPTQKNNNNKTLKPILNSFFTKPTLGVQKVCMSSLIWKCPTFFKDNVNDNCHYFRKMNYYALNVWYEKAWERGKGILIKKPIQAHVNSNQTSSSMTNLMSVHEKEHSYQGCTAPWHEHQAPTWI